MKDLIQEGRKIQEIFKKNVITEEGFFSKITNKLRGTVKYSKYGNWGVIDYDQSPNPPEPFIVNYSASKSYLSKINSMPFAKKFKKKVTGSGSRVELRVMQKNDLLNLEVSLWFDGNDDRIGDVTFSSVKPFSKYDMKIDNSQGGVDNEYKKLLQDLGNVICLDLKKEAESFDTDLVSGFPAKYNLKSERW